MRRWWQLATRNWRTRPGRTIASTLSVVLGVAAVVGITGIYETVRRAIADEVVTNWVGSAHISIEPPGAHWGQLSASFADSVAELDNVLHVTARLKRRMFIVDVSGEDRLVETRQIFIDALGIDPETESHFRTLPGLRGRMFGATERHKAVVEENVLEDLRVSLGDTIAVRAFRGGEPVGFEIVGSFESQRLAEFQKPTVYLPIADLQEIHREPDGATVIEVMLTDHSSGAMTAARSQIETMIDERGVSYKVESTQARQSLLDEAERITRLVLMLVAFVTMLTSFFIILTTMSMSLFERRALLGILRCVGVTRAQLGMLLMLELVPLGIIGTVVGVALGIWSTKLIASLPGSHVTIVYFSSWGIWLAALSGLATTLLSAFALILQVCRVTPLAAVNPEARPVRLLYVWIAGVVGLALLGLHEWSVFGMDALNWLRPGHLVMGTGSVYLGYILLAPAVVLLIGRPVARAVGPLLGLSGKLAEDQFGRAPWRSAGICWMLMVGLSTIVYLAVRIEGLYAIWAFPAQLPSTFVWSPNYVPGEAIERVRGLPGVATCSVVTDIDCEIVAAGSGLQSTRRTMLERFMRNLTRPVFVAGETEQFLSMMKVGFAEGSLDDALPKMKQGGHVLIPVQTARHHDLHLGDKITIEARGRRAEFTVAGVIQSPALDIAVTFFQAVSYMQFAAASAMLGTRADLQEKFGLDAVSMFMCNLEFPQTAVPEEFESSDLLDHTRSRPVVEGMLTWADRLPHQQDILAPILPELRGWLSGEPELTDDTRAIVKRFGNALRHGSFRWHKRTPEQRWAVFRERLVLLRIADEMDRPQAVIGSLTRLKDAVDRSLRHAMVVLTWIPSFALAVAAIGIANLMMVSVHARSRQIAMLRAVGALKSQIIRLVLSEAITLGLLGSIMGLALGFHMARSGNVISEKLTGVHIEFLVPVPTLAMGIALTVAMCLISGIAPARYAARNNIVSALQTT